MLCRPRPLYNDLNKVAIGYKNPLCLTRAKQAQPALYNGHEILKDNHAPAKVHNEKDTLEIAEITRKKINAKMTDPECVTRKVKIAPHDYTKENFLATFTPQKQLTPEQIYWSNDLMKLKSEALKERTNVFRPIKTVTVYPPNTPATLVPKVLPMTSQVKIHIFTLIQMFSEFDKTCKKRITPTAITDGERGFEQTKACYLQEVILFFKTIKDSFEGIQKALTKEVKEMKDLFEELKAEVAQCAVDRKHDAIDRKNLLIANDNLIVESLSKEVFSVATKSELNVARFTKMHVANIFVEARCLALKAELATLHDKSHQENQGELIKHFSKLEVDHLNLQLKYQNLKDSIGNNPPTPDKDTPDFDFVFVIGKMQASLQGKYNAIRQLKKQLSKLQVTSSDTERTVKVRTADSQLTKVTDPVTNLQAQNDLLRAENDKVKQHYKRIESVETIRDIVEEAKVVRPLDRSIVSACRYTKHSQELLEYVIGTCPQSSQQRAKQLANTPLISKKQVTIAKPSDRQDSNKQVHVVAVKPQKTNVLVPPSTGVTSYPKASGSQPKSNPKTNRISPAKGANKLHVEDLPRTNKSHLRTTNRVDSSSRIKRTVINSNSDSICQTCNKCLSSFDHDMCVVVYVKSVVIPHSTRHNCEVERKIKQVWKPKHVERKMKQVWKPKQVRKMWKLTGKVLTTIGHQWRPTGQILHLGKQCPLTRFTPPQVVSAAQNKKQASCSKHMTGDRSRLLNFMKKFIGTVRFGNDHFGAIMGYGDYVVGKSVISMVYYVEGLGHNLFSVGQFCDSDLEVAFRKHSCYVRDTDEAVATACYTQNRSLIHTRHHKTPYELVHNKKPDLTIFKVFGVLCYPTNDSEDLGKLQPTTDTGIFVGYASSRKGLKDRVLLLKQYKLRSPQPVHLYLPPLIKTHPLHVFHHHLRPYNLKVYPPGVVAEPHFMEDHNVAPVDNNPFVNVFASEPHSEASSSGNISSTESPYVSQSLHHLNKWSKDHPLDNVIGNPSRPVSTRKQLTTDALWCLYGSILSKIEPKISNLRLLKIAGFKPCKMRFTNLIDFKCGN
nr:hypothetical protein [Tanacetum cinerariifolium]